MNLAQEIFLLFFAISHGVMLATLPKGSFPTDTALSRREYKNGGWEDTEKFWNISKKRLIVSTLFVNFLPIVYFILVFFLLSSYEVYPEKLSFVNALKILLLPFLALPTHGFYRIYFGYLLRFKAHLCEEYSLNEWEKDERRDLESPIRHAFGSIYHFIPVFMVMSHKP